MNKFEVINWSQYSKSSERFAPCDTLQEAMTNCKHQTVCNYIAQSFKEYSELIELDQHGNAINTYYFATFQLNP